MTDTKTSKSTIITDCETEEKTTFKGVRIGSQQRLSSTTKIKRMNRIMDSERIIDMNDSILEMK